MNRWELVQELFEETLGLDAVERERVLGARRDPELAREVAGLLAAAARPLAALEGRRAC
jgi:hypothetical protein